MPTTIRYPAAARSGISEVSRDLDAQIGFGAVIAWAVIILIIYALTSGQEAAEVDPFQLLATF